MVLVLPLQFFVEFFITRSGKSQSDADKNLLHLHRLLHQVHIKFLSNHFIYIDSYKLWSIPNNLIPYNIELLIMFKLR